MRDILAVDDNKLNLSVIKDSLSDSFNIIPVNSGFMAIKYLQKKIPDLILLDINMPLLDGKETLSLLKGNEQWKKIPVMFLTSDSSPQTEADCLALGADDFIPKPFVPIVMKNRILRILELHDLRTDLEHQLSIKTKQLERASLNSIMIIANIIDSKDKFASGHSVRVALYAESIALKMGLPKHEIQNLHFIALLHDIGKIAVPDSIFTKSAKLTTDEYDVIKTHTVIGAEILKDIKLIPGVAEGSLYHHEHYDGTGYPQGLKGDNIPLAARIISIADAYDSMTSDRVYRNKMNTAEIIAEFERCLGTQFDPEIGEIFVSMLKEGFNASPELKTITVTSDENNFMEESNMLLNKVISEFTSTIKKTATTDALTKLYNRSFMEEKISELLRHSHKGALFIVDMDNFKFVNDNFGHIMGDKILKTFASTLLECISESDYAGRLGGDEFIIFFDNISSYQILSMIAKKIINTLNDNLSKILPEATTSVSMGIALAPDDGADYLTLYKNADRALYYIKENGKNSFHFFRDRNASKKKPSSKNADIATVHHILDGTVKDKNGAYNVLYADFQKIYSFISRYVDRKYSVVQIILFTLQSVSGYISSEIEDEAMTALKNAIVTSLRSADVTTRYSSVQHIVVLMDSNIENGKKVAERIINTYNTLYSNNKIKITYDIESIEPKNFENKHLEDF